MADIVISPNMNLPVPVVGVDAGPDWSNNYNACLNAVDSHNHTSEQGLPIPPAGLNINTDLTFNGNNATSLRSTRFNILASVLSGGADIGCLYVVGRTLYYNDSNGVQVPIVVNGSVTGATGTITGLPSGTASASYAAGTFTFQSATSTPATINAGPLVTGAVVPNAKTVTLQASSSQPANYALTLPLAQGGAKTIIQNDGAGNLIFQAIGTTVSAHDTASINGPGNITNISLDAGTWILAAGLCQNGPGTTFLSIGIGLVSGDFTDAITGVNEYFTTITSGNGGFVSVPGYVVSPSGTTIYYLNAATNGNTSLTGGITAVRLA